MVSTRSLGGSFSFPLTCSFPAAEPCRASQSNPDRLEDGRPDAQPPPQMGSIFLGLPSQAGAFPPPSARSQQAPLLLLGLCTHSPLSRPLPSRGFPGVPAPDQSGCPSPGPSNLRCSSPYWCWGGSSPGRSWRRVGGGSEWCLVEPRGAEQHGLTRAEPSAALSVRSPALGSARECNLSPAV